MTIVSDPIAYSKKSPVPATCSSRHAICQTRGQSRVCSSSVKSRVVYRSLGTKPSGRTSRASRSVMSESDCSSEQGESLQFNLADLFELVAEAVPERVAAVCGADRRTFAQLDERSTRFAHLLQARGAGPGDHVALYMRNSIEHLEAMFGCYKLRAVPINVNYRYVDDELAYLLADADAVGVVHDSDNRERAARVARRCRQVGFLIDVDDSGFEPD